jgi:hypothetical protein
MELQELLHRKVVVAPAEVFTDTIPARGTKPEGDTAFVLEATTKAPLDILDKSHEKLQKKEED